MKSIRPVLGPRKCGLSKQVSVNKPFGRLSKPGFWLFSISGQGSGALARAAAVYLVYLGSSFGILGVSQHDRARRW